MRKYFGTDGVRGPVGGPLMRKEWAFRFGAGLGAWLRKSDSNKRQVLIGRDTRASGLSLSTAIAQGLACEGFEVVDVGVVPTPAVARLVIAKQCVAGVVVSASHNPSEDNGFKLFDGSGCKLSDVDEQEIEAHIDRVPGDLSVDGRFSQTLDGAQAYIDSIVELLGDLDFSGLRVAVDCGYGATFQTTPEILSRLGASVGSLHTAPDGNNINAGVGSEYPEVVQAHVAAGAFDLGIAHDGDGDRVVFIDSDGVLIDGDQLLGVLGLAEVRAGGEGTAFVGTIQSNMGLDQAIAQAGGVMERVAVGDRYVAERMRVIGARCGGENSGHIIIAKWATTGDGLLAAVGVMQLLKESRSSLTELARRVSLFPQETASIPVKEKRPLEQLTHLQETIESWESRLQGQGRLFARYSGTQHVLRLLVEANESDTVVACMTTLKQALEADFSRES
ncbi:MAG: phosphoglucosamine mutase [Opitutales bacterium]|nr:phosphoglucosamine mutase [Opitutales bacterium]